MIPATGALGPPGSLAALQWFASEKSPAGGSLFQVLRIVALPVPGLPHYNGIYRLQLRLKQMWICRRIAMRHLAGAQCTGRADQNLASD